MSDPGLFTSFVQTHRPLSSHLRGLPGVRGLVDRVRRVGTVDDLQRFRGQDLVALIAGLRTATPRLGPLQQGRVDETSGEWRKISESTSVATTRFYFRHDIEGDLEALKYWPDAADPEPRTVDAELMERIGGYENLANAAEQDVAEYWRLSTTWQLGMVDDSGPWALYTFEDLTRDEERAFAQDGSLRDLIGRRDDRLQSILAAIGGQMDHFFDKELPTLIETLAEDRATMLADRAALVRSLELPEQWSPEPLTLDEAPDAGYGAPTDKAAEDSIELELAAHYRLSPRSFTDVLSSIRVWANSVEQNPRGFSHLDEDSISDLLAASLNTTVSRAGREVYSKSGRTDIYIEADALSAGSGPAKVFICETKWVDGRATILTALEDQIFRYATAHTTSAVLLALCGHKRFAAAQERVVDWASTASGFVGPQAKSGVDGWPLLSYRIDGRLINVCIASVSVPRVSTRKGKPK